MKWADHCIQDALRRYQTTGTPARMDFRSLCAQWPWARRSDALTHYLHRYPGKMLPYIPIMFLSSSLVGPDDMVLDVFSGTGTVGVESLTHPTAPRDCILVDAHPLARLISSVKVTPLDADQIAALSEDIARRAKRLEGASKPPEFPGLSFWFRERAQQQLAALYDAIEQTPMAVSERDFFWACYSSIVRDVSRADPRIAPPVRMTEANVSTYGKEATGSILARKGRTDGLMMFARAATKNVDRLRSLQAALNVNGNLRRAWVVGDDAKALSLSPYRGKGSLDPLGRTKMPNDSIGMVICSPPYINAQKYARSLKLESWWLGIIGPNSDSLHRLDETLVGTERVRLTPRTELGITGIPMADSAIKRVARKSVAAAGIVQRYVVEMSTVLAEVWRVLAPGRYCIMVVGNNKIQGRAISSHLILSDAARASGFEVQGILRDEIRSRGMITKRHPSGGIIADEWILVLRKPSHSSGKRG